MKSIEHLTSGLKYDNGIWICKNQSAISYPVDANEVYKKIEEESFWFAHRSSIICNIASRLIDSTQGFLDIGGGNGYNSLSLQRAGFSVVMLEPGSQGILNARQRGIKNLIHATLKDASFKPGSVDNAGLFDVLEHIENDVD